MISFGVDIGGTGCKCAAFQEDGRQMAASYCEYPLRPGEVNLSAGTLRDSVFSVIRGCADKLDDRRQVAAITVSSFGESFVPLDRSGQPLTDMILYFADTPSGEFDALVRRVGREKFMEITCALPDASYSLAKILYTRRITRGPVWKYLFAASYLTYCLSGQTVADYVLACRSILFDVRRLAWSEELLGACGVDEAQLPAVLPAGSVAGTLLPGPARELGLPPGVQIVVGSHDQIVNALGCGVCACGDAADITGTVECIVPLFAAIPPALDFERENYACVPYPGGGGYVTYAYNVSGGAVVRWYRDSLAAHLKPEAARRGCGVYDLLNETCPRAPTDLLVLPYLQGMGGTPDVRTGARGLLYGLRTGTAPEELYRAVLEGLTFEMAYNLERLRRYGIRPQRLYAGGGGARSSVWLQIKADILGVEIVPSLREETGALGSAVLGFAAVSGETDLFALAKRFVRHADPVQPIPEHHAFYRGQYEQFKTLRAFLTEYDGRARDGAAAEEICCK